MRVLLLLLAAALTTLAAASTTVLPAPVSAEARASARLIETAPGKTRWMAFDDVVAMAFESECGAAGTGGFMDVTQHQSLSAANAVASGVVPPRVPLQAELVHRMLAGVSEENIKRDVTYMSTHWASRYYQLPAAKEAVMWLRGAYEEEFAKVGCTTCHTEVFPHEWLQPSLIARYPCAPSECIDDAVVILGGHVDSITKVYNTSAPGADDDASGTSTVLEAARVLLHDASFKPRRTIEFHAYAAEELGLLGSQDVAAAYQAKGVKVAGMLQLDMTAWTDGPSAVVQDFVDKALSDAVMAYAKAYTSLQWAPTYCGYACSDHGSWTKAGYPSAKLSETDKKKMLPYIHTVEDTLDKMNWKQMVEFGKLAVAYLVELSHAPAAQ